MCPMSLCLILCKIILIKYILIGYLYLFVNFIESFLQFSFMFIPIPSRDDWCGSFISSCTQSITYFCMSMVYILLLFYLEGSMNLTFAPEFVSTGLGIPTLKKRVFVEH